MGRFASSIALTTRALPLKALEGGGGGEAKGDSTSAVSASSAGRGLRSKDQQKQQKDRELGKEKAYSSMVKYFLRFSRQQG